MITYKTKDMILTTTPTVEDRTIIEYKGIVFGEAITGVNFIKDFGASLRNFFGGRSGSYERELLAPNGGMLMVTASGTAVKLG